MLCRDCGNRSPWPTWPNPDQPDFTHLSRKVKQVIRAAGVRDNLSFTSFRYGGFTEGGDADAGAGSAHDRQGAPEIHRAYDPTNRQRRKKASCFANKRRSIVRMNISPLVRMAG